MSIHLLLILFQAGALVMQVLPFIAIFALFYFMVVMPQRKKQQALQEMLNNIKVGDKVITTGGLYGSVAIVRDKEPKVQLKVADNPAVKLDFSLSSIAGFQENPETKS